MTVFELDRQLAEDTVPVAELSECRLLLMNDTRWPWLILVPRIANAVEWHDLQQASRDAIDQDVALVAQRLKELSGARKINIAMLGNMVSQLHIHVVARQPNDPNWPGPVWGYQERVAYADNRAEELISKIRAGLGNEAGF